jgi:hypothetical protein
VYPYRSCESDELFPEDPELTYFCTAAERERRVQQRIFIFIASFIVGAIPKDNESAQQYAVVERSSLTASISELIVYL